MRRVVMVLALLACNGGPAGSGSTESWPHAVAQRDCAPWDGAATSVHLTTEPLVSGGSNPMPMLRLSVYHDIGGVRGARWPLGDSGPDSQYDVVFPDGVRRAGEFRAPVQEFQALCG